jgi:hypothetical protein
MNNKIKLVLALLASEVLLLVMLVEYSANVLGR